MIEGLQRGFLTISAESLGAETVASEQDLVAEAQEVLASATGADKVEPGVIQKFIEQLPEKILVLGVRVLLAVVVFLIGMQIIKLIRKIVRKSMDRAGADKGVMQFVDSFLKAALYIILIFTIGTSFGVDAASIVALLGSAGVAIGLAVQGSLSNLAGGILLLLLKPFKVGDYIVDSEGHEGTVTSIQIFYTKLLTIDNKQVVLPNGTLSNNALINVTGEPVRRADVNIGISYQADIRTAREVLLNVLREDRAVDKTREMRVFVDELGSSSVNLIVRCWFKSEDYWEGLWRIRENCKYALDNAGIEIPFPQMDVHMKQG